METRAFYIVNPHSGSSGTGRHWPEWQKLIETRLGRADFSYTQATMHAAELARAATEKGYNRIVAVGGDGTLNEVLNGFFRSGASIPPEAALAYIPNGTGADFARSVGFHGASIEDHVERLVSGNIRHIDCAEVHFYNTAGEETNRLFINESSLGFSAETAAAVNRASKHVRGKLPFLIGVARCLSTLRNPLFRIAIDGKVVHEDATLLVAVTNGCYFGGGMKIAPLAEVADGLLDVIIVGAMSRLTLMRKIKLIYSGRHLDEPEVTALRGRTVHITAPEEDVLLEMDGEQPGKLAADYRVSKKLVPFIC